MTFHRYLLNLVYNHYSLKWCETILIQFSWTYLIILKYLVVNNVYNILYYSSQMYTDEYKGVL